MNGITREQPLTIPTELVNSIGASMRSAGVSGCTEVFYATGMQHMCSKAAGKDDLAR